MSNRPDMYMQYIQNSVTVLQQHAENSELNRLRALTHSIHVHMQDLFGNAIQCHHHQGCIS